MRDAWILRLAGLVGLGVFLWALVTQAPAPRPGSPSIPHFGFIDVEELARSLDTLTARLEEDFFDAQTWREMARLFQMCPDPDEAVRAWSLVAPASLIDERAGAAVARFFTISMPVTHEPLREPYNVMARDAADELRRFTAEGGDRVTILHWRALAWTLTLSGARDEAPAALEMMRTLALNPSSELPLRVRADVLRSMSFAWSVLGEREKSLDGWRRLAMMIHEADWEAPELNITWNELGRQFASLRQHSLRLAAIPRIIESAINRREQSRRGESEWWPFTYEVLALSGRPDLKALSDDPSDPLGRPRALEACDRIESEIPRLGHRGAGLATLLGVIRRSLGDEEGAERALLAGAELHQRRADMRPENPNLQYELASALALAGLYDKALDTLERAVDGGWSDSVYMRGDPTLASLRDDSRFVTLIKRLEDASSIRMESPMRMR